MLSRLKNFLETFSVHEATQQADAGAIRLAAAVLLVEVMMADHEISEAEKTRLSQSLSGMFDLQTHEVAELINLAEAKHEALVSLQEMTSVINAHFDYQARLSLIREMWRVAYADRKWDKYEEHLIRKVADLLYVSHKDFVRCRHEAQKA